MPRAGCGNGPDPASFEWISPNGASSAVLFTTAEPLSEEDEDMVQDVYERSGGETTLVSTGPESRNGPTDASFAGASPDGSHLFFNTSEALLEEDGDTSSDIYQRSGGETTLVSTGAVGGNGSFSSSLHGVSEDGADAFFTTKERLAVDDDFLGEEDVYKRVGGATLLVSVGNDPGLPLAPPPPTLQRTDPESPGESTEPLLVGQTEAGAAVKIYTSPECSEEEPVATGSGEELASPGIAVSVEPGSTTSFYATAEIEGFVSACSSGIAYTQASGGGGEGGEEEEEGGSSSPPRPQKKAAARVAGAAPPPVAAAARVAAPAAHRSSTAAASPSCRRKRVSPSGPASRPGSIVRSSASTT